MSSPRSGYTRLGDLGSELDQIRRKRQIAADHGADPAVLARLDNLLQRLSDRIGDAAAAEARREIREALDEAGRLARGQPERPTPRAGGPGDQNPGKPDEDGDSDSDDDEDHGGDGGGGGGGGGAGPGGGGGFFGIPPAPAAQGDRVDVPGGECIYVRSASTVWAWNRYRQSWDPISFGSELLEVRPVSGGILVVAAHGAAIWECSLLEWLPALRTDETLISGASGGTGEAVKSAPQPSPAVTSTGPGTGPGPSAFTAPQPGTPVAPIGMDELADVEVPDAGELEIPPESFPPPPLPHPSEPTSTSADPEGL